MTDPEIDGEQHSALVELLQYLKQENYQFVTPTPLTHQRVNARAGRRLARNLRDAFGWSLPFERALLPPALLASLQRADAVEEDDAVLRSRLRVSSLGADLYVHSAYPTLASDAVFFGPDTYRFCRFIEAELPSLGVPFGARIADIGCGSGAGGIVAARATRAAEVLLGDINPRALQWARINAAQAGVAAEALYSDVLAQMPGDFDLLLSNPPYLNDEERRAYRHGGGALGFDLSLRIAAEALPRLRRNAALLLYSGVAITDGVDPLLAALQPLLDAAACEWRYCELDPDVFGEELEREVYRNVDRIAAVGLVAVRRR